MMVDYVWEMTVKKFCKYGKCGSFEQLLFLYLSAVSKSMKQTRSDYIITVVCQMFITLTKTIYCVDILVILRQTPNPNLLLRPCRSNSVWREICTTISGIKFQVTLSTEVEAVHLPEHLLVN